MGSLMIVGAHLSWVLPGPLSVCGVCSIGEGKGPIRKEKRYVGSHQIVVKGLFAIVTTVSPLGKKLWGHGLKGELLNTVAVKMPRVDEGRGGG